MTPSANTLSTERSLRVFVTGATGALGRLVVPLLVEAGHQVTVRPAHYDRSVLDAEAQAKRFTAAGRVGVVLRFGAFYGPDDPATLTFMNAIRRGWFPLPGRRSDYYSWVAHEDAAQAVVAALHVPPGTYNLVEGEPLTRGDLADGMAQLMGVPSPRFLPRWMAYLGGGLGETLARSLRISSRAFVRACGWTPRYRTMLESLAAVISEPAAAAELSR
jgi:nucleoside-diphosphate-sugar epimerase